MLVLAGALAANRRARLADATILKILGATRTRLSAMFLIEYAILGAATAAFAVVAGALIAYLVVTRILFGDFAFDWVSALAAAGGGLAFTVILGMIGAWRILGQKPAAYLRSCDRTGLLPAPEERRRHRRVEVALAVPPHVPAGRDRRAAPIIGPQDKVMRRSSGRERTPWPN